jgi:hypothetical protein
MADRFSFCGSTAGPFNSGANHLWSHQTGAAPDPGRTGRFRSWDPRRTAAAHPRAAAPARSGGSGRQGTPRSCTSARHRRPTAGMESRGRAWAFPSPVSLNLRTTTTSSTDQRPCCESGSGLGVWCRCVSAGALWLQGVRRLCAACGGPLLAVRCVHAAWQGSRCQATWGAGPRPPRLGPAALGAVRRAGGSPLGRAQPRW